MKEEAAGLVRGRPAAEGRRASSGAWDSEKRGMGAAAAVGGRTALAMALRLSLSESVNRESTEMSDFVFELSRASESDESRFFMQVGYMYATVQFSFFAVPPRSRHHRMLVVRMLSFFCVTCLEDPDNAQIALLAPPSPAQCNGHGPEQQPQRPQQQQQLPLCQLQDARDKCKTAMSTAASSGCAPWQLTKACRRQLCSCRQLRYIADVTAW